MFNHVQQILAAVLTLLFGVLAMSVARQLASERPDRAAAGWMLTAWCFTVVGTVAAAHALFAFVAWMAGPESGVRAVYDAWTGPANFARIMVVLVYAGLLVLAMLVRRRRATRLAVRSPVLLAGTLVMAMAAAYADGQLEGHRGVAALGVLGAATAMVLMGALLAAVVNDGLDQLLWFALAAYALKEVISTSLLAILVWGDMADQAVLMQAFRVFYWLSAAVMAGMSLLAMRRRSLAAAGRHVPALFERMHALRTPAADWSAHR